MKGANWVILPLLCAFCSGTAVADLTHLRIWPQPDVVRIVLESSIPIEGQLFSLDTPHRIVVDVTSLPSPISNAWEATPTHGAPIDDIRVGRHGDTSRVVFQLTENLSATSFHLAPDGDRGHRMVIDMVKRPQLSVSMPLVDTGSSDASASNAPPEAKSDEPVREAVVIVVIDPGHGGRDPGAIGPAGTFEKNVVLSISEQICDALAVIPGIEGVLTRETDTYIGLRDRTHVARKHNAELFVSIHADAAPRRSAQGGSVYVLSDRGVSSETARWLATNENQAITAEDSAFLSNTQDQATRQTLLDLSMSQSIGQSLQLGDKVLSALGDINSLHKPKVERANFAVLRSPDIASLLIETGFISNPEEEQRLNDPVFQAQLAQQIANAIATAAL